MPLRDHFRSPLDDVHSWDELHNMWPAQIVEHLTRILPEPYFAAPGIFLGSLFEVDVSTFRVTEPGSINGDDGVATYSPPQPTLTLEPELPNLPDVFEVRIHDRRWRRHVVAVIEIVSPSNKDRPDSRAAFATKVAALLANGVCVSIVDVVGTMNFNLYADLLAYVRRDDPALGASPPPIYAATLRTRGVAPRKMMDLWYHPLAFGQTLPTLPLWLHESLAVSLDLEASYEDACRALRIR